MSLFIENFPTRRHPRGRRGPVDAAVVLNLAVLCLIGCESPDNSVAEPAIRDSADIRIVENRTERNGLPSALELGEPAAVIGATDEDPLHGVGGVVRLGDGTIVVADNGTREIRFYPRSPETPVRAVGGSGAGPGEFEQINGLFRFAGDSIAAWDPRLARLSIFDPSGELDRTVHPVPAPVGNFFPVPGVFDDGSFLAMDGIEFGAIFADGTGVRRPTQAIMRYSAGGELLDTLSVLPGDEQFSWVGESGFALRSLPFGKRTLVSVAGDRVYISAGDRDEVSSHGAAGQTESIARLNRARTPVTGEDIEAHRRSVLDEADGDQLDSERRRLDAIAYPEYMAPITAVIAGEDGTLWLREALSPEPANGVPWSVLTADGLLCARLELPANVAVRGVGPNWLLAVETDDLGVETVQEYPINVPDECAEGRQQTAGR